MDMLYWFNASAPWMGRIRLWNLFNRRQRGSLRGWEYGAGLLQVRGRHAVYVGSAGICLGFVWIVGSSDGSVLGRELES